MNQTLVPGLYNGAWYNGKLGKPGFLNDKMSFVVGVARIRQLRVKSGKYPDVEFIKGYITYQPCSRVSRIHIISHEIQTAISYFWTSESEFSY